MQVTKSLLIQKSAWTITADEMKMLNDLLAFDITVSITHRWKINVHIVQKNHECILGMSHVLIVDEDDIGDNDNNDGDDDA